MNRQLRMRAWPLFILTLSLPAFGAGNGLGIRQIITDQIIPIVSPTQSKLDTCCTTITTDFSATRTLIDAITSKLDILVSPCNAQPLTTPQTITEPGYYCLANDCTGTFFIAASNVVFDLNNHTIRSGTDGIVITGDTVTIKNGTIQGMSDRGIVIQGSGCTLANCTLVENHFGIFIDAVAQTTIVDCRALHNTVVGFWLQGATQSTITRCAALDMESSADVAGFVSIGGADNTFSSCQAADIHTTGTGQSAGFVLEGAETRSRITQSTVSYITTDTTIGDLACGINLISTTTCQVTDNTVFGIAGNPGVGISADSTYNYVATNVACDTTTHNYSRIDSLFLGSQANAQGIANIDCSLPDTTHTEQIDFTGTYTMLATVMAETWSIESKCEVISSQVQLIPAQRPIEQGTTPRTALSGQSIMQSGSYFLRENVTGGIAIGGADVAAQNITLDLNGFSVSDGITVQAGTLNLIIKNGTLTNSGIVFSGNAYENAKNILINDVSFVNGLDGIITTSSFPIENLTIRNCRFSGQTNSCIALASASSVIGLHVLDCFFDGSAISTPTQGIIQLSSSGTRSTNIELDTCQFIISTTGCLFDSCDDIIMRDCSLQGVAAGTTGVSCNSCKRIAIERCKSEENSEGFRIASCNDVSLCECETLGLADDTGFLLTADALYTTSTITLERCVATNHANGFQVDSNATNFTLTQCIAQRNVADGFQINTAGTGIIKGCKAEANGIYGFADLSGGSTITYVANVASNNGTANYTTLGTPFYAVSLIDAPTYWQNAVQ